MTIRRTKLKPHHAVDVFAPPWPGVHVVAADSAAHFRRHYHESWGIGQLDQGAQYSASGVGAVEAFAGDIITTNPGEVHDGRPLACERRRWRIVYLQPSVLQAMDSPDLAFQEFSRPVMSQPTLRSQFDLLYRRLAAWATQPALATAAELASEEALLSLLGSCAPQDDVGKAPRAPVASAALLRVRERLSDESTRAPSLAELALIAHLSRFQVVRAFKRSFGMPPYAWYSVRRSECAREHIRAGRTAADAAAMTGFADQSHMTRAFVRHFGFTPGAWQRAVRPTPLQ